MKKLILLSTIFSQFALAQYDENKKVVALANSGRPIVSYQSADCPNRYGSQELVDRLGKSESGHRPLCVRHVSLPQAVLEEVREMKAYELENESDYDQRITALHVFDQSEFTSKGVRVEEMKRLASALGIPKNQIKDMRIGSEIINQKSFLNFAGLYVGTEYIDVAESLKYLRNILNGKKTIIVKFGDGVTLYPGGGFSVSHYILITDDKVIYVKNSYWDA